MPSVSSLLRELSSEVAQVQPRSESWVCDHCLGPVDPAFRHCYACGRLLKAGVPPDLADSVVPITIALNPSRWYSRLATYKAGHPSYRAHLAALLWSFMSHHEDRLADLAGGALDIVSPVPSKRGRSFLTQPLAQVLAAIGPARDRLADALAFVPAPDVDWRREYYPHCFDPGRESVDGKRVLLVEDSWVTGATAWSAAGALKQHGAAGVAILAVARVVDMEFWEGREHPYLRRVRGETRQPFDVTRWVR